MVCDSRNIDFLLLCFLAAPMLVSVQSRRIDVSQHVPKVVANASQDLWWPRGAGLLGLAEGCEYAEQVGFHVGDKVRIYKPGATGHNAVDEVVCPRDGPETEGLVCLNREGCWSPGNLRKMTPFELSLQRFKSRAGDIASACGKRFARHWPGVPQKVAAFAADTRDEAVELGGEVWAAVTPCDPETRSGVQHSLLAILSSIDALAHVAANRRVATTQKLTEIADATKSKVIALGEIVGNAATSVAEGEMVQEIVQSVVTRLDEFKSAALEMFPRVGDILSAIIAFLNKVAELSIKAVALVKGAFEAETQAVLASIHSGAGKLLSATATKWRAMSPALKVFASATAVTVAWNGDRACEAVNLCNPEVKNELRAALATVQSRVARLAAAISKGAHHVQGTLQELSSSLSAKVAVLSEQLPTYTENVREKEEVQAKIATIKALVVQLNEIVSDQRATMRWQAGKIAERILWKAAELILKATRGETSTLDDKEDVAEM